MRPNEFPLKLDGKNYCRTRGQGRISQDVHSLDSFNAVLCPERVLAGTDSRRWWRGGEVGGGGGGEGARGGGGTIMPKATLSPPE